MIIVDEQYARVTRNLATALDVAARIPSILRYAKALSINSASDRVTYLLGELSDIRLGYSGGDRELSRSLARARVLANGFQHGLTRAFDRTVRHGPGSTDNLIQEAWMVHTAINQAHARAHILASGGELVAGPEPSGETQVVGRERLPLLVLSVAVGILPLSHRSRYMEEFRAELADHGSWHERLWYSFQVAINAWPLRENLSGMPKRIPAASGGDSE